MVALPTFFFTHKNVGFTHKNGGFTMFYHVLPAKIRVSPTEMLGFYQQALGFHWHVDLTISKIGDLTKKQQIQGKLSVPNHWDWWGFGFVQKSPTLSF